MRSLASIVGAMLLLPGLAAAESPRVPLDQALRVAGAVVVARIEDPSTDQQVMPKTGTPSYVRRRWRLVVTDVLKGKGIKKNKRLLVDEAGWQLDLATHKACAAAKQTACPYPQKPSYDTQLSREPRAGDTVLALLRPAAKGWELAFDTGFDAADRAVQARGALSTSGKQGAP